MNRPLLLTLAAALALSACRKPPEAASERLPVKEKAAGVDMIDFDSAKGTFSCLAPAAWKAREDLPDGEDGVTFIGPLSDGRLSFINVVRHPGASKQWSDATKYAESFWELTPDHKQPALEKRALAGAEAILFHYETPYRKPHSSRIEYMDRYDYALIPVKGGFFELWHSAPADRYRETLPVFEAVVRGFKPKI